MAPRKDQYRSIYLLGTRVWGRTEANEQIHDIVYREYRIDSLKALSVAQADDLIKTLRKVDGNIPRTGNVSLQRQIKKISMLGFLLQWSTDGIRGFMHDAVGKSDWNDLTASEANSVIKRMNQILKSKLAAHDQKNQENKEVPHELPF